MIHSMDRAVENELDHEDEGEEVEPILYSDDDMMSDIETDFEQRTLNALSIWWENMLQGLESPRDIKRYLHAIIMLEEYHTGYNEEIHFLSNMISQQSDVYGGYE